jgi:hypothetical protein
MSLRAIQALTATNIAAATGGLTWMFLDWRIERKWSTIGICSGIIAGLVRPDSFGVVQSDFLSTGRHHSRRRLCGMSRGFGHWHCDRRLLQLRNEGQVPGTDR